MRALLSLGFALALSGALLAGDTVPATGGDIEITPLGHASLQIEHGGRIILIDPWSNADLSRATPGDLVLVTDLHPDHLDVGAIAKVRKSGAPVVMPAAADKAGGADVPGPKEIIANGETRTVAGVSIEAIPMYNLERGPKPGMLFHDRGRGNGYILTVGGKRIYVAGDTECTPEMRALENIDVAFVPMNLPYTMPPNEAAECVRAFGPGIAYPYHFRGQDPQQFVAALKGTSVEVRVLPDWYPPQ